MQIIKFNNSAEIFKADLFIDTDGHIKIKFMSEEDVPNESVLFSGFVELNEHNYMCQSDFTDMRYLHYKKDSLTYILTKKDKDILAK